MNRDERFAAAVELAKCFILNGDIRLGDSIRPDSPNMMRLGDLIDSLYNVLSEAEQGVP